MKKPYTKQQPLTDFRIEQMLAGALEDACAGRITSERVADISKLVENCTRRDIAKMKHAELIGEKPAVPRLMSNVKPCNARVVAYIGQPKRAITG